MKFKFPLFFLCCFVAIGLTTNSSCKKNEQDYLQTLITKGNWQLSSVWVTHYTGAVPDSTDTLNTICDSIQLFKFNMDNTCTYTNFDCLPQKSSGNWSFTSDKLFFNSNITVDSAGVKIMPFKTAKIQNLGQYSLILLTGDLETYYSSTQKRNITQYGFVRQKTQ